MRRHPLVLVLLLFTVSAFADDDFDLGIPAKYYEPTYPTSTGDYVDESAIYTAPIVEPIVATSYSAPSGSAVSRNISCTSDALSLSNYSEQAVSATPVDNESGPALIEGSAQ